jgi:nicotinate-nucleotide adenylyltransferase
VRIAILGGSFNPVHTGHLYLADTVLARLGYHRIILIPAFQSPFKPDAETASPTDRLDMLAASITGDPRLTIDDCEIRREGVSYTVDTIADICRRYHPEGKPGLILGDDLADTFHHWRNAGTIVEQTGIIIARRLFGNPGQKPDFPFPHTELDNEVMNVSSRLLRKMILRGENWRYLVPAGARDIIESRRLYGLGEDRIGMPGVSETKIELETLLEVENAARKMLSPSRFLHSRNTALMARDLCLRFNLDPRKGYLAGIAHDMCKSMGLGEIEALALFDGGSMTKLEKAKPSLLHGRAAAALLKRQFGIYHKDVLDAVRYHTTAGGGGDLARVVYVADKIEASREDVNEKLREMSGSADLNTLFTAALDTTVAYLRSQKMDISSGTLRLLAAMHKKEKL